MKKFGPAIFLILIAQAISVLAGVRAFAGESEGDLGAWKGWKSIEAAIAIRPLDGPEDIIERAEIIEDRVDDLAGEGDRIEGIGTGARDRLMQLRNQREVLRDLEEIRMSGDAQSRRRLQEIILRVRREEDLLAKVEESAAELASELIRMRDLAVDYRERAEELRKEERERK